MKTVIETQKLSKKYGSHMVVNNVELMVPEGSIYGFIGPNGAGKSTTMKLLLGLIHPSAGAIQLLGKELNTGNRLELLKATGSLIESPSCYGHLSAQENLEIVCNLKGVPYRDIDRVLEIVGLVKDRKRKLKEYSLGMHQRLGIAQALLGEPKLLILDEPTNGLDPAGIQEMRTLISEMPKKCGATVLISSHLLSELEHIINHVGIINQGKLLFQGTLVELQQHSRGDVVLQVLQKEKAGRILCMQGIHAEIKGEDMILPPLKDDFLAYLVRELADGDVGVVGLQRKTKSLEEIFLSLTASNVSAKGQECEVG